MARKCVFTGKSPLVGNNVSHANNKTKKVQLPNIQTKRIYVSELNRFVRVRLSTRALRTVSKLGLIQYMNDCGIRLKDIEI
ncbi:MAG: 50S ribosomal protein L28 [Proteobacteria bacterium]|nr:50S ribosomal protein L28 [Pseudomonadota bacterium]